MAEENPRASHFEPLSALWRVLAAPQTLLVLVGLVALVVALGTLIPQIPSQAVTDPQAWLAVQSGSFGQRGGLVRALALFDLFHAFWFRLLLVLTGLVLFVRVMESADLAWRAMGRAPWTSGNSSWWGKDPPHFDLSSSLSVDEVKARLNEVWSRPGYWSTEVPGVPVPSLVAGRRRVILWARPVGYGALLLALVGLVIAGSWGWQSEEWQPVPGESRAVGHDSPYTVVLDSFHTELSEDGQLQDYHSEVTWLEGDFELGQDVMGVGRPSTRHGVTVRQVGYAPVVRMRGWDSDGRRLTLETGADVLGVAGEVELRFSSSEAQPLVLIPGHDLFLAFTFEPLGDGGRPALHVDRIQGDGSERQALEVLYESGPVSVDGLRLEVDLTYVPILRVDYQPAMGLVVVSMALVVVALFVSWLVPPWLVWIVVGQGENDLSLVRVLALPGAGTNRWLPRLDSRLREVLADEA